MKTEGILQFNIVILHYKYISSQYFYARNKKPILKYTDMSRKRKQSDIEQSSEQAREQQERIEESEGENRPVDEEQRNADDLDADQERDYQQIQELDRYERQSADDEDISQDHEARRKADRQIEQRQGQRMENIDQMDDLLSQDELNYDRRLKQRQQAIILAEEDDEIIDQRRYLDAEQVKGKLPEWIGEDETLKYIKTKFTRFLTQYKGNQQYAIYSDKIRDMAIQNKSSLQISYEDLRTALPTIAIWVGMHPQKMMPKLNDIAYYIACKNFPTYRTLVPETYVKITNMPFFDLIRDLRYSLLDKLVKIKGVITIRSQVLNQMKRVFYKCGKCGQIKGPFVLQSGADVRLGNCNSCQSSGPFTVDRLKTIYRNFQKMTIQQSPSDVLPGRIPRSKQIIAFGDNTDIARPGDEVQVVGIFKSRYDSSLNVKQGFPLFNTFIEAIHIIKCAQVQVMGNDEYLEQRIRQLSSKPNIAEMIYGSIAPSIYGHYNVKRGLTLAMFGGVPVQGLHRVRGDINVLLLGDPGTAKSQFLKSVQKVFHRCIYTTGKGASAVGLTASVKRDFQTNQWKLEAGALVLADKGICLIDEFDKMNEHDRTSIHEAMEQQSISISKAGIVASLRARCSVIAAANPIQGRYNSSNSFSDNVDLSDPILSRFDILSVIKDEVDQNIDYKLATFVINSHMKNHPYAQKYQVADLEDRKLPDEETILPYIQHKELRQYIKYAREKIHPQLTDKNRQLIKNFFSELREASRNYSGIHVSIRQVQSIIRISVAHAKLHLRSEVQKRDIDVGIAVLLQSFIQTQKHSTSKELKKKFGKYLIDAKDTR